MADDGGRVHNAGCEEKLTAMALATIAAIDASKIAMGAGRTT
ncbi:MAG: hypothetical protein ABWZ80_03020 [Beijerinckiaceae bacterium]